MERPKSDRNVRNPNELNENVFGFRNGMNSTTEQFIKAPNVQISDTYCIFKNFSPTMSPVLKSDFNYASDRAN